MNPFELIDNAVFVITIMIGVLASLMPKEKDMHLHSGREGVSLSAPDIFR